MSRINPMPLSLVLTVSVMVGCNDEAEPPTVANAPATVAVEGAAPPVVEMEASHGGTIVAAGPHPVEVVTRDDGAIEAYVVGDVAPAPEAQLTVTVQTERGPRPVVLAWEPTEARYYGVVEGPTIVAGPTEVVYVVEDRAYRGRVDTVVVVEAPRVRRPRADVVVRPPRGRVVVEHSAPAARVDVHLGAPAPPGVVVQHRGPRIRHTGPRIRHRGPRIHTRMRHRRHHRQKFRRRGRR